jgi:hypothetical protein
MDPSPRKRPHIIFACTVWTIVGVTFSYFSALAISECRDDYMHCLAKGDHQAAAAARVLIVPDALSTIAMLFVSAICFVKAVKLIKLIKALGLTLSQPSTVPPASREG